MQIRAIINCVFEKKLSSKLSPPHGTVTGERVHKAGVDGHVPEEIVSPA